jgi:hypothetical protein
VPLYLPEQCGNEENQAVMTRHGLTSGDDHNSYCVLRRATAPGECNNRTRVALRGRIFLQMAARHFHVHEETCGPLNSETDNNTVKVETG